MKITAKISFLAALIVSIGVSLNFWFNIAPINKVKPAIDSMADNVLKIVRERFPADLVINLKNGNVTINQPMPYCLILDKKENAGIIFDDNESPNITSFENVPENFSCKPIMIVGKNYLMTYDGQKEKINIDKIPTNVNADIDQKMLFERIEKYGPIVSRWGWTLYLSLPLVFLLFTLSGMMLLNFWYSLIFGLVAKLFKIGDNPLLKDKYWIALFFASILEVINQILSVAFKTRLNFPFSATILITLAGIIYLNKYCDPKDLSRSLPDNDQNHKRKIK